MSTYHTCSSMNEKTDDQPLDLVSETILGAKNRVTSPESMADQQVGPSPGRDVMESKHQGMSEAVLMMIPQYGELAKVFDHGTYGTV